MAAAKFLIRRKCPICGCIFQIRSLDSVYCSHKCSNVAYKRKQAQAMKDAKLEQVATSISDVKDLLSVSEAVALFNVERDTLYRCIRSGKITPVKFGPRQTRIRRSVISQIFELRSVARDKASKPIPTIYSLEPKDCYTIGKISKKYNVNDSTVWAHIRKYSIPTRQIGNYVYAPKSEIDKLYKSDKA